MTETSTLSVARDGKLAFATLNRPSKLNALNAQLIKELHALVAELCSQSASERPSVLIVTGSGDKAFAAGADVAEMSEISPEAARAFSERGHRLGRALEEAPFPVIAQVNGFALGGGLELALACDFIYASDRAKFGLPEVGLGLVPGFGGTQRLTRRVGIAHARELVFSGATIDAARAQAIGLVNDVVPHAELAERVKALSLKIAEKAPLAVAAAKRLLLTGESTSLGAACELESRTFGAAFATDDGREGMRAFVEKRAPKFESR
jgi:enoyl-CoA hydratase